MIQIPQEIITRYNLPPTAFLSGSRAMGFPRKESDWDVCIPVHFTEEIKKRCDKIEYSEYFDGFTTHYEQYKINFIPLHPFDMLCWILATKTISEMHDVVHFSSRIRDPNMRHGLFETFRGVFKTSIVYDGEEMVLPMIEENY